MQIIGHGVPGVVSLGYRWVDKYAHGAYGPYYVLDGNPFNYEYLFEVAEKGMTVNLVGCQVGGGTYLPPQTAANGPSLLFDLAQLWQCEVVGPTAFVNSGDFDETGRYKMARGAMVASGLQVTEVPPEEGDAPSEDPQKVAEAVEIVALTGGFGTDPARLALAPRDALEELIQTVQRECVLRTDLKYRPLALPDFSFAARWMNRPGRRTSWYAWNDSLEQMDRRGCTQRHLLRCSREMRPAWWTARRARPDTGYMTMGG